MVWFDFKILILIAISLVLLASVHGDDDDDDDDSGRRYPDYGRSHEGWTPQNRQQGRRSNAFGPPPVGPKPIRRPPPRRLPEEEKTFDSNSNKQCPCLHPPGSTACIPFQFDASHQASSLEEALLNFDKPNELKPLAEPSAASFSTTKGFVGREIACNTVICKRCAGVILDELDRQSRAQWSRTANQTYAEITRLRKKYSAAGGANDCPSLDISPRLRKDPQRPIQIDPTELAVLTGKITGKPVAAPVANNRRIQTQQPDSQVISNFIASAPTNTEATPNEPTLSNEFASIYKLDCTGRGEPVEKGSVHMSLCSTCWQWGVLADDYYPQYVNLMTCQKDSRCLSGYGECRQRTRSVQVLKRVGTSQPPSYKPYSVDVPVCCDCQVKAGTALHNLVQG